MRNLPKADIFCAVVCMAFSMLWIGTTGAGAGDFMVTTPNDGMADDGEISLREAFMLANADPDDDSIQLLQGMQHTIDCDQGESLTVERMSALEIRGGENTSILNPCGFATIRSELASGVDLTITEVEMIGALTSGDNNAAVLMFGGSLTITGSDFHGFGGRMVIDGGSDGSMTLTGTRVFDSAGGGIKKSAGPLTLEDSQIFGLMGPGKRAIDAADSNLVLKSSKIRDNRGDGVRTTGAGTTQVEMHKVDILNHGGYGFECSMCETVEITDSTISGNGWDEGLRGGGVYVDWNLDQGGEKELQITDSTIADNSSRHQGGGIHFGAAPPSNGVQTPLLRLVSTTVSGNSTSAPSLGGGGIYAGTPGAEITLQNSTVTDNTAPFQGGGLFVTQDTRLTLDHVTLVGNTAFRGAGIAAEDGELHIGRSILALPRGGGSNCELISVDMSTAGFSVFDDTSCGRGSDDRVLPGADLMLGPLEDNGGSTLTMLPADRSPIGGLVPERECDLQVDQRGMERPLGKDCEPGAVEIVEDFRDCNSNGVDDEIDISDGTSEDVNDNRIPDECEIVTISCLIQGTATGGDITVTVEADFETCVVKMPTTAGDFGTTVVAELVEVLGMDDCLVDQGITAEGNDRLLTLEGFHLLSLEITTTDQGLVLPRPVVKVPILSAWGLVTLFLALSASAALTLRRRRSTGRLRPGRPTGPTSPWDC